MKRLQTPKKIVRFTPLSKSLFLSLLATFWTFFNSCSNDLEVVEAGKQVPIVYGFLNMADSATYIRVEKSFVNPAIGAPELAKVADSLYYKDITVWLVRVSNARIDSFQLTRVDGNLEGYPRDSGAFARTPNTLYKINNSVLRMAANERWRITVRQGTKILTQATTAAVGNFILDTSSPQLDSPYVGMTENSKLSFNIQPADIQTSNFDVTGRFFDLSMTIFYEESTNGTTFTPKSLQWQVLRNRPRQRVGSGWERDIALERAGLDMLRFMANNIPKGGSIIRRFKNFDIRIDVGSDEINAFTSIAAANAGITGSQTLPTYTNLSNGAFGLFAARNHIVQKNYRFGASAMRLLKESDITKDLNFR